MSTFPARAPSKLRPRFDFEDEKFRRLIFTKGIDLSWEQCAECPCARGSDDFSIPLSYGSANQATGEARSDCALCDGTGYFWHSAQDIRAVVTSSTSKTEAFALYGEYARGMVQISTLPEHLPSYGDRFTVLESVRVYRETRVRGAGSIEALRYPIQSRTLDLSTGLSEVRVLRFQYANADGTSAEANSLTEGVDFTVTAEGKLDLSLGDAIDSTPTQGTRYSVSYFARPRYYVADHPHVHRDSVRRHKQAEEAPLLLPIQVQCSLEFLGG